MKNVCIICLHMDEDIYMPNASIWKPIAFFKMKHQQCAIATPFPKKTHKIT